MNSVKLQDTKVIHRNLLYSWTFFAAQWIRIRLLMQGTWVWSLVWEDSTCYRATKPVRHNYWRLHALGPASCNCLSLHAATTEAHMPRACAPREKPPQWVACALQLESSPCSPQVEKSPCSSEDPAQPKSNRLEVEGLDRGKEERISSTSWRYNSVYDPFIDFAGVLCSQSRNQSMLNFITFLKEKTFAFFRGKPRFFNGTKFKGKLSIQALT